MAIEFVRTDRVARPMGPFSVGVRLPGLVITAGQLPVDAGGAVVPGGIKAQTRQSLANIQAVLVAAGTTMDRVVKLTVFLKNMDDLGAVAEVRREFWQDPHPTSTTVEISRLPHPQALVEIEAIAVL